MRHVAVSIAAMLVFGCGGGSPPVDDPDADAGILVEDAVPESDTVPESDAVAGSDTGTPSDIASSPDGVDGPDDVTDTVMVTDSDAEPGSDAEASLDTDASDAAMIDVYEVVEAPPPEVPGDHCSDPIVIDPLDLPFQFEGDTTHAADDVALGGGCATGGDIGAGAPDVVFSFTAVVTAHHVIGMNPMTVIGASPAVIYVVESCEEAAFGCVGVSSNLSAGGMFSVYLEQGVTYAIVVDGLLAEDAGGFSFVVEEVVCVIQCPGPECGKDGCGGFCGEGCAEEEACRPDGICDDPLLIEGNTCELPFVIDALPFATTGDTWYGTHDALFAAGSCPGEPNTIGGASNDHFYQLTIETTGLYSLAVNTDYDSALYVITDCASPSTSCVAGADASLGAEAMEIYLEAGQVVTIVVDGYGNSENMNGIYTLQVSQACVASCEGKVCGSDGCSGSCGTCGFGDACEEGVCVTAPQGDTCLDPFVVDAMPFTATGDTTDFQGDVGYEAGSCPGIELGWGAGSNDVVYAYDPPEQDLYTVSLEAEFDSTLYVITDCLDVPGTCLGADDQHPTGESIDVWMYPGTMYFIVVDGYGNLSNPSGEYTLSISPACVPQCKFKDCGDDGCGGLCGECESPYVCNDVGVCESQDGNSCATPYLIESVPFTVEGNTDEATNLMGVPYDACPDETAVRGPSSAEQVWSFTPSVSGVYTGTVDATFPVVLYTLTDCTLFTLDCFIVKNPGPLVWYDVEPECGWALFDQGQCVGLDTDFALDNAHVETRAYLEAGTTYYYVVDGNALGTNYTGAYTLALDGPCFPACEGKVCGDDGCGMDCGECTPDLLCDVDQQCVTQEGNSCETPFVVPADVELPVVYEGNTWDATNAYGIPYDFCPSESKSSAGAGSRDEVYVFTPVEGGTYEITLESDYQGVVYVLGDCVQYTSACYFKQTLGHDSWTAIVSGCGFTEETCLGSLVGEAVEPEEILEVDLLADQPYYIVVDGLGGLYDTFGAYTLTLDLACQPQCEDKECGDDGCEDVCGECPGGFICDEAGQCIDETNTQGNTCENPHLIETIPFLAAGDTLDDSHVYGGEDCIGLQTSLIAEGARDEVWAFTPELSGIYLVNVNGQDGFEPVVYVVEDCTDEAWSCLKGTDDVTMDVALTAGETYFIVVDGGTDPDDPPLAVDGGYVLEVTLP